MDIEIFMKNEESFEKFVISQVAIMIKNNKCLILEFASLPGKWGLPGGRIDKGELGENAFKRELEEELGITNFNILDTVSYGTWTTPKGVPICGIASIINGYDKNEIKLSHEHIQIKWVAKEELNNFDFIWPCANKMIEKGFDYLKK